jgi:hypothetical protein
MELPLETFDRTFAFLTSLTGSPVADEEPIRVLQGLLTALRDDGYALINEVSSSSIDSRLLSSESSSGSVNVTAIVLVLVCIICAGLASGLTQVASRYSIHRPSRLLVK